MVPKELRQIIPPAQLDFLRTHQLSQEFYREVQYRQALEVHYRWYHQTAESHRKELQKMRRDINVLGWFRR
jgi:hypothetical protein